MPKRRRPAAVAAVAAVWLAGAAPVVLPAQASQGSIEVGAARLRHRDVPATDAATAGANLRYEASRYTVAGAGGLTVADGARSTAQGLLAASLLGRPGGLLRWEVGGALTAFGQGHYPLATGAYLLVREHFAAARFGGWAGIGLGGVEDLDRWYPTRSADAALWYGLRAARLTATAVLVDTRSEPYESAGLLVTDRVTYTDASLGTRWTGRRRLDVDGRAGLRLVSRGALTATGRATRPFAAVDAAYWITPRLAVVAAVGRQLADLARGTPDTRFAALALRWSARDAFTQRPPSIRRAPTPAGPRLVIASDDGQSRLVVVAPGARLVELAASFTAWEPTRLTRQGDYWQLDRTVSPGVHRVLIRVDSGEWLVPANLSSAPDDFGGAVGVVTIP